MLCLVFPLVVIGEISPFSAVIVPYKSNETRLVMGDDVGLIIKHSILLLCPLDIPEL